MTARLRRPGLRTATAFAPGHVTGFFRPERSAADPRARGSVGAGLVLSRGVTARATWTPAARPRLSVRSEGRRPLPISREVARRMVAPFGGSLSVALEHQLPIGQGFGMSSAGALATAMAVGRLLHAPAPRVRQIAHLADLFGGGGLGGVAAILGTGFERRLRPGIPPWGRVLFRPFRRPIFAAVVGPPIPSPKILSGQAVVNRITASARRMIDGLPSMTVPDFLAASEQFTDSAGLDSPGLRRCLDAVRGEGAWAAQAMFGHTIFAVPRAPEGAGRLRRVFRSLGRPWWEMSAAPHRS